MIALFGLAWRGRGLTKGEEGVTISWVLPENMKNNLLDDIGARVLTRLSCIYVWSGEPITNQHQNQNTL